MIASLEGKSRTRDWERLRSESISKPVRLEAGKRYWVEALHREASGADLFAVTWQMPDEPPPKSGLPDFAMPTMVFG